MKEIDGEGTLVLRVKTRPNDANKGGDIFGGWLMSQIDIAGAIAAAECAKGPVVTVAVKDLKFIQPLFIYDIASFYTKVTRVGSTSVTVEVEVFAQRYQEGERPRDRVKVSDATLIYVAVSKPGQKRTIPS
ncbi:acyl-CoA thioesterase [Rickettsiella massiliensis]|uniref:acyl-CoA thioesterase n=1 Tax=Rickettsiella massiliensis TaxID=676517 RepID=UPI00029B0CFE|nr:hotdog domain-containing protein [Rickettsiella massiliensis]